MSPRTPGKPCLFVLDTNVLMHDPASLFRFHEHDIYLPMAVLEELDAAKKGASEVARNARQASRTLDSILEAAKGTGIDAGVTIPDESQENPRGRIYFQTSNVSGDLPEALPGNKPDNAILALATQLIDTWLDYDVIVVSKDINLRIKAHVLGIQAEDYLSDQSVDDVELLPTGVLSLEDSLWDNDLEIIDTRGDGASTWYEVRGEPVTQWYPRLCLAGIGERGFDTMVTAVEGDKATLRLVRDHSKSNNEVWGVSARNSEQNFAFNLLMDPSVDLVTLLGAAGTGKTLLALAAGLTQVMDTKQYREIVVTRVTISVGEDIGFLPGTEEEKMEPWMGALMDNLEVLTEGESQNSDWGRAATNDLLHSRIKIRSLNFMRGRTFLNRYLIIDEAQNLTSKQLKTLLTRAGPAQKSYVSAILDRSIRPT